MPTVALSCNQATHRAPEWLLGNPPGPGASQHGPSRGAGAMQLLRRATAALQGGGTPAASPAPAGPPEGGWLTEGIGSGLDAPGAAALAASDVLTGEPVSDNICRSAAPLKQCRDFCLSTYYRRVRLCALSRGRGVGLAAGCELAHTIPPSILNLVNTALHIRRCCELPLTYIHRWHHGGHLCAGNATALRPRPTRASCAPCSPWRLRRLSRPPPRSMPPPAWPRRSCPARAPTRSRRLRL